mmetsp:Transcript_28082/g.53490  ORF Transcript_28082/g.53490 Transcript_28082/m.53490 type:complete len:362 (+) Transcript_28082:521-1606(+)
MPSTTYCIGCLLHLARNAVSDGQRDRCHISDGVHTSRIHALTRGLKERIHQDPPGISSQSMERAALGSRADGHRHNIGFNTRPILHLNASHARALAMKITNEALHHGRRAESYSPHNVLLLVAGCHLLRPHTRHQLALQQNHRDGPPRGQGLRNVQSDVSPHHQHHVPRLFDVFVQSKHIVVLANVMNPIQVAAHAVREPHRSAPGGHNKFLVGHHLLLILVSHVESKLLGCEISGNNSMTQAERDVVHSVPVLALEWFPGVGACKERGQSTWIHFVQNGNEVRALIRHHLLISEYAQLVTLASINESFCQIARGHPPADHDVLPRDQACQNDHGFLQRGCLLQCSYVDRALLFDRISDLL